MKKILILFITCSSTFMAEAQTFFSPNGVGHTPTGNLKCLVIVAATPSDCINGDCDDPNDIVPINDWFYSNNSQFSNANTDVTISNFFYQSSRHHPTNQPFRITGSLFEDIIITNNWLDNYGILKIIATDPKYDSYDFSGFDTRTNKHDGSVNNAGSNGDKVLDYIVIVWKNNVCKVRSNDCGGYSTVVTYPSGSDSLLPGNFRTNVDAGFTITNGASKASFIHEFSHSNFNSPHYAGANGLEGPYFRATGGYGLMNWGMITSTPLAWESWYLGWIDLKKTVNYNSTSRDLDSYLHNGNYTLKDFISTGDAMRIKLPFVDQYLWIENHKFQHPLDQSTWLTDGSSNQIPSHQSGLLMYIERMASDRNTDLNLLSVERTNGIKFLHSQGNYDYTYTSYQLQDPRWWNNVVINFNKGEINPTGIYNKLTSIKNNYPTALEGNYPNGIITTFATNNSDDCTGSSCLAFSCKSKSEAYSIVKLDNQYTYGSLGIDMAFAPFQTPAQNIGLSYNTVPTNYQEYDACNSRLEPIILNGISIIPLALLPNGSVVINIKFDETHVYNNINGDHQRFTGRLEVHDIANAAYDLDIQGKLVINKSGLPDRHTPGPNNDFINNSSLTIFSPSKVRVNGQLNIEQGSALNINNGSELYLEQGASLVIDNSKMCLENTDNIIFNGNNIVTINNENYSGSITINQGETLNSNYKAFNTLSYYHNSLETAPSNLSVDLKAAKRIVFYPGTRIKPIGTQSLKASINNNLFTTDCSTNNGLRVEQVSSSNTNQGVLYCSSSGSNVNMSNSSSRAKAKVKESKLYNIIYPNPNSGTFIITFPDATASYRVELVDVLGNKIYTEQIADTSSKELAIANLPSGLYIVNVTGGGITYRDKIQVIK